MVIKIVFPMPSHITQRTAHAHQFDFIVRLNNLFSGTIMTGRGGNKFKRIFFMSFQDFCKLSRNQGLAMRCSGVFSLLEVSAIYYLELSWGSPFLIPKYFGSYFARTSQSVVKQDRSSLKPLSSQLVPRFQNLKAF